MKAIDVIRTALETSDRYTMSLIEDMKDAALTTPTSSGGNHPLWVLGHLALVEGLLQHVVLGEPNPAEHLADLFGPGTEPSPDPDRYPSFDELLATYRTLRARNLRLLESLGEAGISAPTKAPPPGMERVFATVGGAFTAIALHQMNHGGQVADARRAAGRKRMFIAAEQMSAVG